MVSKRNKLLRSAFTFVELIFAIVIISISVISLPMMIQITAKGVESNIVQEAIFAASAELMGASSGYWDARSMNDGSLSQLSRVIDTNSSCVNDTSDIRHRLRPGHIAQPYHRRCIDANSTVGPLDASGTSFISLDDAAHPSEEIFTDDTTDSTGYKEVYESVVTVTRTNDIKFITVNVTHANGDPITTLRMQSANIGEIDYFKRRF